MTEHDFQRIENVIGRPLSMAFRRFMLSPPPELRTTVRDTGESPAQMELCDAADGIIELNRRFGPGAISDWPANQLVLGDNGCGDVYSVDLDDSHGAVYLSGPHSGYDSPNEDGYFEKVFDSLPDFARHLISQYKNS